MPEKVKSEDTPKLPEIKLILSPEIVHGVYANYMVVQFTPFEFQLNFAYILPQTKTDDNLEIPADVVAKVNIPVPLMPNLIRALEENYTNFLRKLQEAQEKFGEPNE